MGWGGSGLCLGHCGFWKTSLPPLIPRPLPRQTLPAWVCQRRGPRKKRNEGQIGPCRAPLLLHRGLWLGVGEDSSTHCAGLQSQMEAQWALQKASGHLAGGAVSSTPDTVQVPRHDSETQTVRGQADRHRSGVKSQTTKGGSRQPATSTRRAGGPDQYRPARGTGRPRQADPDRQTQTDTEGKGGNATRTSADKGRQTPGWPQITPPPQDGAGLQPSRPAPQWEAPPTYPARCP